MTAALTWLAIVVAFAAVMAGLLLAGRRIRQRERGATEAFVGPWEEIWHPAAHNARLRTEVAEERMLPLPPPDDRFRR